MSAIIKINLKDVSVDIFFSSFLTTKPFSPFLNSGDKVRNTQCLRVGVNLPGFKTVSGEILSIFYGCGFVTLS